MHRSRFPWLALGLLVAADRSAAQHPEFAAARSWLATAPAERGAPPGAELELTRGDVPRVLPDLFRALQDGSRALGGDTLAPIEADPDRAVRPSTLSIGAYRMPYVLMVKGERPATGWPLYLCLHGGGGNAEAKGPHEWDVNDREFQAQKTLFRRIYPSPGLYFIPRMADDREGRWWYDHNQQAFDDVIRQCILFRGVDPDRVHLLGISEGGYGAIRFAAHRPDRFAGCNGMAAAEPLTTSPPENMRNVAFRIDIGEKDTMFDRVGLAQRMAARLAELRQQDASGYDHVVDVQKGRGHGIDYARGPQWLSQKVRNPYPDRVVWTVAPLHRTVALQHHWLALPERPAQLPLFLDATLRDNVLTVTAQVEAADGSRVPAPSGSLLVRLNDRLADLDRPLSVTVNGRQLPPQQPQRTLATLLRTLVERGDPQLAFAAELVVPLTPE